MPEVATRSISTLQNQYDEALRWLENMGVKRSRDDRFEHARQALRAISEAKIIRLEDLNPEREATLLSAMQSRREASDLIRVHRAYRGRDGAKLRYALRRTRSGKGAPEDETASTGDGRRSIAELSWGALLEESGFGTRLDEDPDVLWHLGWEFGDLRVSCEVKSLHSMKKLGERVGEGARQIQQAVDSKLVDGGMVVVVVDRLMEQVLADQWKAQLTKSEMPPRASGTISTLMTQLLSGSSESDVKQWAKVTIEEFARANATALDNGRGYQGVVGVRLWWRVLALVDLVSRPRTWAEFHQQYWCDYRDEESGDPVVIAVRAVSARLKAGMPV